MKIIKKGYIGRLKKCNFCKTKFMYENNDISFFGYIYCPACSKLLKPKKSDRIVKEEKQL